MTRTENVMSTAPPLPLWLTKFRLADGSPLNGWTLATRRRRAAAWALDLVLILVTLGIGWAISAWRLWAHGTTPGKARLGLVVFATDTRLPATQARMALRGLVYRSLANLIGLATAGIGWIYVLAGANGTTRRTLYDDWSQTIVLAGPAEIRLRSRIAVLSRAGIRTGSTRTG
ncbi:MAG: RDD family protein [Pseudonocardiaceae bacterium]